MRDDRGPWRHYHPSEGIPCDPLDYVDVCDKMDVYIDVPAYQSFDAEVTHWRPSIDDTPDRKARRRASLQDSGTTATIGGERS